jgi:outer membrane protein OmpA-like peptidoglycan-associated protein
MNHTLRFLCPLLTVSIIAFALAGCTSLNLSPLPSPAMSNLRSQGVQIVQIGANIRVILPTDKCFESNTPIIKESCEPVLQRIAAFLTPYRNVPMTVTGYTDAVMSPAQAQWLSHGRAESVVAYLWAHGIPHQQLSAAGRGAACPIAQNDTVVGSAMNRRVEITLRA